MGRIALGGVGVGRDGVEELGKGVLTGGASEAAGANFQIAGLAGPGQVAHHAPVIGLEAAGEMRTGGANRQIGRTWHCRKSAGRHAVRSSRVTRSSGRSSSVVKPSGSAAWMTSRSSGILDTESLLG